MILHPLLHVQLHEAGEVLRDFIIPGSFFLAPVMEGTVFICITSQLMICATIGEVHGLQGPLSTISLNCSLPCSVKRQQACRNCLIYIETLSLNCRFYRLFGSKNMNLG